MRKKTLFEAYLDDYNEINVFMSPIFFNGDSSFFFIEDDENHQVELEVTNKKVEKDGYHHYTCTLNEEIAFGKNYVLTSEQGRTVPLVFAGIVKCDRFDEEFYYEGNDLGLQYTREASTFKVWAPTAANMKLEINQDNIKQTYEMVREDKGVYSCRIEKDLLNAQYVYIVQVNGQTSRSLDPYGKVNSINSKSCIVVDLSKVEQEKKSLLPMESVCDAIIYETSIRDFTSGRTFKSFISDTNDNRGFSYLKALGITHVQLLPVLNFRGVDDLHPSRSYNWGYDVHDWFALENSYSSDIDNPMQAIFDLRKLVNTCHESGIRVNLDVVFNHIVELNDSCLQQLVPYYYFQLTPDYHFSNATMCGNDVDSTRKMCSKIIKDACLYLLQMFDIDGLRFDLMGILDVDTMNDIVAETRAIKADFMIYGEGWNMPSTLAEERRASIQNNAKMPAVAHFSDIFRDTMKGRLDDGYLTPGFILGNTERIYNAMNVLAASVGDFGYHKVFESVENVINFVECHDNMTSWDQLNLNPNESEEDKLKRHKLLIASVLLAQGIPFLHSGQEGARTKQGVNDSYNLSDDINHLDYDWLESHADIVEYTKQLIEIRKTYKAFRMHDVKEIYENIYFDRIEENVLIYKLKKDSEYLEVIFNVSNNSYDYDMKEELELIFYNQKAQPEKKQSLKIMPLSLIILKKTK